MGTSRTFTAQTPGVLTYEDYRALLDMLPDPKTLGDEQSGVYIRLCATIHAIETEPSFWVRWSGELGGHKAVACVKLLRKLYNLNLKDSKTIALTGVHGPLNAEQVEELMGALTDAGIPAKVELSP